jgi:peroxiredoxin
MAKLLVGEQAPDFTLADSQGQTVELARLRGAPVLLNFFKSDCSWCQVEMPKLAEVYRRLTDLDLHVVGVAVGEEAAQAEQFAREKKLDFPVVADAGETGAAYGLERVPTLVLIDAAGIVAQIYEGSSEQLAGIVEQTMLAAVHGHELPDFSLVGNGCAPDG